MAIKQEVKDRKPHKTDAGRCKARPKSTILTFLVLLLCFTSCYSKKNLHTNTHKPTIAGKTKTTTKNASLGFNTDAVIDYAERYLGCPYKYGGNGPQYFDCSGFTKFVFANFGITIDRISADQAKNGKPVSRNDLQPGDLVFFKGKDLNKSSVGHVGIVKSLCHEKGEFYFIHVSSTAGVIISKSTEEYYRKRYITGRRVTNLK